MKRLTNLANKHHTDKGTEFEYCHGYTEFYEPYFLKYEHPTILELGVQYGASTLMFNDFYDGDCELYCIDIDKEPQAYEGMGNVHFYNLNLGDEGTVAKFINELGGVKFDIIIDDASHIWRDQYISLINFRRVLKEDGIFIIEDLHTSYDRKTNDFSESPLYFLNFFNFNNYFYSEEECSEVSESIKDVVLYNHYSNKNPWERSITSIITFKK